MFSRLHPQTLLRVCLNDTVLKDFEASESRSPNLRLMAKPTDIRVIGATLYFLPVQTRMPLKFGPEITTSVTCARVALTATDTRGRRATGWGETPLSVQWVWPGKLPYESRHEALKEFCRRLAEAWAGFDCSGHPMEVGHDFTEHALPKALARFNEGSKGEPVPWLAALVCDSAFDLALHDAFGRLVQRPVYETYNGEFMNRDLAAFLNSAPESRTVFSGTYPGDFLVSARPERLRAWHLVGGLDLLAADELTGTEPDDGYPVLLPDWIERDGLKCLKIKLRGNDPVWDYERLVKVGRIAVAQDVEWLTADFNCTVTEPAYVNVMLDRLRDEHPRLHGMILYVEQPFPYELEHHRIDVRSVSARKPLFLDESAHDWRLVKLGYELGWTGVALKTCKTQTGALLSACWAKAHGMTLMVQDLTNPMLAQIPHVLLAAHTGTIMGVETNAMQFYPEASRAEAAVHPGLFQRRQGMVDLSSVTGPGFGYRLEEIKRELPNPEIELRH
jgi:L-alanine-DL-glutamate epimerase-like enolase superfamily enzyme